MLLEIGSSRSLVAIRHVVKDRDGGSELFIASARLHRRLRLRLLALPLPIPLAAL